MGGLSLLSGTVLAMHAADDGRVGTVPTAAPAAVPAATLAGPLPLAPAPGRSGRSGPGQPAPAGFVPERVAIPSLSVTARVMAMSVGADRSLGVPDDPRVLGWWRGGAAPGQPAGSVVIDGHVNSAVAGRGAFFRLHALRPGDQVTVSGQGRSARYVVIARRQYPKAALPPSVFDQQVAGRLVLITCGGPFDRRTRHYADNVVVFARPA